MPITLEQIAYSEHNVVFKSGKEEGKIEGKIETIRRVLAKHPDWTDEKIADLLGCEIELVKKCRLEMSLKS